jgi:hypothetical protein
MDVDVAAHSFERPGPLLHRALFRGRVPLTSSRWVANSEMSVPRRYGRAQPSSQLVLALRRHPVSSGRSYGFHPLLCFADATGGALSGMLRPGNAGSNTAADHVSVLDDAVAQLPTAIQAGHHEGDNASLVTRQVICRTDSGGTTGGFLSGLRARNIGFSPLR